MKKITAYEAKDGSVHRTEKDAAIHDFRTQHAGVFGEDALAMMLQRPRELGELLLIIGREDVKVPAPRVRNRPEAVMIPPAKDTKARKRPSPGARKARSAPASSAAA